MWRKVSRGIWTATYRTLGFGAVVVTGFAIGGVAFFGIMYAAAGAIGGAVLLLLLIMFQLPMFLLLRRAGLIPPIKLHKPHDSEQNRITRQPPLKGSGK